MQETSQTAQEDGKELRLARVGVGEAKEPKVKMEQSITLGVTISVIIRPQPGVTETSRAMDAGKEILFLSAVRGHLIFVSVVLDPILFGKWQWLL